MGSLIAYSGISTKVKAMERWRISDAQFEQMASLATVPEAVQFLKQFPPYAVIFEATEEKELHRGYIEQKLNQSQYREFAKLYRFSGVKQREFLDLFFMHYEIDIIKTCLRNAAGHRGQRQDLSMFRDFFERHSRIDLIKLSETQSIEQFVLELKDTPYYGVLWALAQDKALTLPTCETALDMLYFKMMWKKAEGVLPKSDREILRQCFGTRMDMLNLQWIYRSKKYYRLMSGQIYAMIIPISLHLKKQELHDMVEAESVEKLLGIIRGTWYGRLKEVASEVNETGLDLEKLGTEINDRIYEMTSRKNPYSLAVLNSFLYFKEREIKRIITTIEKIRYGVSSSESGVTT